MSELLQEFERTRTFKYFYSTLLKFDESLNCYVATEKWRNKEAELLTAAWWMFQEQQATFDELKDRSKNMEICYIQVKKERDDAVYLKDEHRVARVRLSREQDILQKRIDAGLEKIHQFGKEGCLFPEWLTWAEKALRGDSCK